MDKSKLLDLFHLGEALGDLMARKAMIASFRKVAELQFWNGQTDIAEHFRRFVIAEEEILERAEKSPSDLAEEAQAIIDSMKLKPGSEVVCETRR